MMWASSPPTPNPKKQKKGFHDQLPGAALGPNIVCHVTRTQALTPRSSPPPYTNIRAVLHLKSQMLITQNDADGHAAQSQLHKPHIYPQLDKHHLERIHSNAPPHSRRFYFTNRNLSPISPTREVQSTEMADESSPARAALKCWLQHINPPSRAKHLTGLTTKQPGGRRNAEGY